jgi:hypothetical protein
LPRIEPDRSEIRVQAGEDDRTPGCRGKGNPDRIHMLAERYPTGDSPPRNALAGGDVEAGPALPDRPCIVRDIGRNDPGGRQPPRDVELAQQRLPVNRHRQRLAVARFGEEAVVMSENEPEEADHRIKPHRPAGKSGGLDQRKSVGRSAEDHISEALVEPLHRCLGRFGADPQLANPLPPVFLRRKPAQFGRDRGQLNHFAMALELHRAGPDTLVRQAEVGLGKKREQIRDRVAQADLDDAPGHRADAVDRREIEGERRPPQPAQRPLERLGGGFAGDHAAVRPRPVPQPEDVALPVLGHDPAVGEGGHDAALRVESDEPLGGRGAEQLGRG